ncbi:MAG: long-chain fatty acid--CoA ligase [Acidobacteria bacterium]|nr:long-chain fatty acid--CoA ligase [Acidobacteriota bacterium]MCA1608716.1 long-chain fatty acid--CoA ligase [Acidobacteriota bacterium]
MGHTATSLNLASIITHHARLAPQSEAIVWNDVRMTFGELDALSNKVANLLVEMNIGRGDKVALSCPNLPYFPVVYYGVMKAGGVVVPLNVLFKAREVEYHLRDSDAKAVFVFEGTDDLPMAATVKEAFENVETCTDLIVLTKDPEAPSPFAEHKTLTAATIDRSDRFEIAATAPDDTCAILYTSGTTGQPKGAELTHLNLMSNVTTTWHTHLPVLDFTDGEQKTCLITLPLFHTTGQTVQMNTNLYGGSRCVLLPRFDPQTVLETMVREKVNFWVGVPTMYWGLLKFANETGFEVSGVRESMKVCTSGGAPMPVEVMKAFKEKFGVRVLEGYGLSETSPLACFNHFAKPSKPGTVGQAIFGVDVKCFDESGEEVQRGTRGEIVIRGANVMKGYYKRPEATAEAIKNGWFYTGDIGVIDDEGYVSIVDRKKDMILRGGYNVYPRELEEVIMTHPAVSLCAVIGVPDERMGEEVKAYVVLKQEATLLEDEFIAWCKKQFAANKYPRYVEFRESLPIGGTGKIFKRALREEAAN